MFYINIKRIGQTVVYIFLLVLLFSPIFINAQVNNPPPDSTPNTGITYECVGKDSKGNTVYGNCEFNDVILATKKAVNFAVEFTLTFSVVVIAWAGFKYMISGDNSGERKQANEMLLKVAKGIGFILAAWLIVTLITNALLTDAVLQLVPLGN